MVNLKVNEESVVEQEEQKLMVKVLNLLQQKSEKALEKAKKFILNEKIENKRAREALEYYVGNWNDTTHPGILALACEAVGGSLEKAEPMQIAMLYLAAAVDLHDDIIDQSKVKNGKPTVFGKYGRDITLLLGDIIMVKGFTFLYNYCKEIEPKRFEMIICSLKTKLLDLGNAHLLEVDLKRKTKFNIDQYMQILEKKASSIEVNTEIGAIIGGGSLNEIEALARYGRILGTLIGLREDFIDIFEPDELKNRMRNEILPLPLIYTFKNVETRNNILKILSKPKISKYDIEKILEYVFQSKEVQNLKAYMQNLAKQALQIVSGVKNKVIAKDLSLLINASLEDL